MRFTLEHTQQQPSVPCRECRFVTHLRMAGLLELAVEASRLAVERLRFSASRAERRSGENKLNRPAMFAVGAGLAVVGK